MRVHSHRLTLVAMAVLLAGSWLAASSHPQPQRSGPAQADLRAAMDKETVDGDLPAAIKLYQAIVDKYVKTERAAAAAALVHLGECYQRLGDKQARAAFERILKDFPDVSDAATTARARLAALGATDGLALAMRRVYSFKDILMLLPCGAMSSDARYMAHPGSSLDSLSITDVRTGQVRQVWATQAPKGSGSVLCAAFSPDDRQIAFHWMTRDSSEIRIIGVDGTGLRTLVRDTGYQQPLDWSPDGRQILAAAFGNNGKLTLLSVQVATGATRVLKPDGLWRQGNSVHAAFSPDGAYVAYSAQASAESGKYDVFVMKSDGTGDAAVVQHPANDAFLGWSPDGGAVLFLSDRTGVNGVWSIEVAAGRPRGVPVPVKDNVGGIEPVRMIGGTLYYGTGLSLSDMFLASLDPATGAGGEPRSAKAGLTGSDHDPDWSPDGRSLAYRSTLGGKTPAVVSILNVQTGVERQLRLGLERLSENDGPHWSPDGRSLLVIGMYNTPEHGLYRVDAQTGDTTPLFKIPAGQYLIRAVWSRDGRSVFYAIGGAGVPTRYVRRDLASGADVDLVSMKSGIGWASLALSPDGQRLAFTAVQSADTQLAALNVVSTSGGAVQPLYRAPTNEKEIALMPVWSPDGGHVYFRKTGQAREYWRVGADGSGAEKTAIAGPERNFSISPDGRQIVFSKTEQRLELWAFENLAPRKPGR